MTVTVKELVEAAEAMVPRIGVAEAKRLIAEKGALLLDVRDMTELEGAGRAAGSHHIPRGMLEFRADPASPWHDAKLRRDRPVILYCAGDARAALGGKTLKEMGFSQVFNIGGLKDWQAGGGAVAQPMLVMGV